MPGWPVNLLIESPAIKYTIIFEKCTQQKPPHLIDETVYKKYLSVIITNRRIFYQVTKYTILFVVRPGGKI